jgi:hypothetical protein
LGWKTTHDSFETTFIEFEIEGRDQRQSLDSKSGEIVQESGSIRHPFAFEPSQFYRSDPIHFASPISASGQFAVESTSFTQANNVVVSETIAIN